MKYTCFGDHCLIINPELRILPTGGLTKAIICHSCYLHELHWRKTRNSELGMYLSLDLPKWDTLAIYNPALTSKIDV